MTKRTAAKNAKKAAKKVRPAQSTRAMNRTRKVTLPGTNVKEQTRSMTSMIEQELERGVDESEVFPFG